MEIKKLEPKHLIPYLPYSLKVIMEGKKTNVAWMSTKNIAVIIPNGIGEYKRIPWKRAHLNIKPILRPLSDLTKEIEIDGKKIIFIKIFFREARLLLEKELKNTNGKLIVDYLTWEIIVKLLEYHFDIFELIPKGLAIDINTL